MKFKCLIYYLLLFYKYWSGFDPVCKKQHMTRGHQLYYDCFASSSACHFLTYPSAFFEFLYNLINYILHKILMVDKK